MSGIRSTIAVAIGAIVGATVRWAVVETFPVAAGWPWAIFIVNVAGSLLLGGVLAMCHLRTDEESSATVRLALGTGFCGALTTFSTLAVDIAGLLRDQRAALATSYLSVSLMVGVVAFMTGRWAVTRRQAS